jgi:outer membrane biosynthesis protein TonB
MNPGRFLRAGITASAAAHLLVLMLVLFFTEVHRFGSVTAEPITVDLVSPAEAPPDPMKEEPPPEPAAEPKTKPPDAVGLPSKAEASPVPAASPAAAASPPPAAPQPPAARPQQQAALPAPSPTPQPPNARSPPPPPAPPSPTPAYAPPQPDLSVKYGVLLGLPPDIPVEAPKGKPDDFDAQASKKADIDSSLIAQFRRHLKTCSKLPPSIAPSDSVMIRLRVFMTTEGKLAAEPVVIEGSGNLKGLDLRQSAIDALQACQPYAMLPVDRYGEWKVLDLTFTPQDFGG